MAYTIQKTDGTTLGTVPANTEFPPGTPLVGTGTTLDLTLYGRGRLMWGSRVDENFVHLLENFARGTAPLYPLVGQIWYNVASNIMFYWDGTIWQELISKPFFLIDVDFGADINVAGDANIDGDVNVGGWVDFEIPSSGLPADSNGVRWVGNTDEAKIYVQEESPQTSIWVYQLENNTEDFYSFRTHKSGDTYPSEIMRLTETGMLIMGDYDGSTPPPTAAAPNFSARDHLVLNMGRGASSGAGTGFPDIYGNAQLTLASDAGMHFISDAGPAPGARTFHFQYGALDTTAAVELFQIGTTICRWAADSPSIGAPFFQFRTGGGGNDLRMGEHDQVTFGASGPGRALSKTAGGALSINRSGDFSVVKVGSDLDLQGNSLLNAGGIDAAPNNSRFVLPQYAVPSAGIGVWNTPGHNISFTTKSSGEVFITVSMFIGWNTTSSNNGQWRLRLNGPITTIMIQTSQSDATGGFISWTSDNNWTGTLTPNTAYTGFFQYASSNLNPTPGMQAQATCSILAW